MSEGFLVLSADQKVLDFKSHGLWGWENLKKSIQTVLQFFPMADQDIVILNDPSAGGLFPWALTAIHKVGDLFIARSLSVKIPCALADKIDGEALRIPPTPLVQKGVLQNEIYQSLIQHPLAGPHLASALNNLLSREAVLALKPAKNLAGNRSSLLEKLRRDLPTAESASEVQLNSGEILKLKMEASDRGFVFDFTGTSPGQKCFLSETLVHGLCHQHLAQFLNLDRAQSLELSSMTQFLAPKSSFLQAKFPQGQLHGLSRGSSAIWQILQKCLQTIYARQTWPQHQFFPLWLQLQTAESLDQWILPCGTGATERESGIHAFPLDGISQIPALEQIQKYFEIDEVGLAPLRFQSRVNSGSGLNLLLRAKANFKFTYINESSPQALKGNAKYSAMDPSQIIFRGEKLPAIGEIQVQVGDPMHIQTGTGAGLI